MAPVYTPMMTPEQQRQFQLSRYLNAQGGGTMPYSDKPLTYEQWLMARGAGNPYAQVPQTQQPQGPDIGSILNSFGGGSAGGAATNAATSGASAGAGAGAGGFIGPTGGFIGPQMPGAAAAAPGIGANAAAMGAGPIAAIIAATALGGKAGYDMLKGKKPGLPGRVVLGMATGGLSEVANKFLNRKSTKDYQKDKWENIAKSGDAITAQYAKDYRDNYLNSEQAKTDARYENTFEGKKAAGTLKAEDVWGGEGFFDTFGNDWLGKLSEDQRRKISQAAIDNNLISTSKGMMNITDAAKLKELSNSIVSGKAPVVGAPVPKVTGAPEVDMSKMVPYGTTLSKQPAPIMIPRSSTLSPGIGKDGKRINYGR